MQYTARQYAQALHDLTVDTDPESTEKKVALFVSAIKKHKAGHLLPSILKSYQLLLTKKNILPEVVITTAEEMTEAAEKDILTKVGVPEKTKIIRRLNPEMIGGVTVKSNNLLFDLSLKRRLNRLSQKLRNK